MLVLKQTTNRILSLNSFETSGFRGELFSYTVLHCGFRLRDIIKKKVKAEFIPDVLSLFQFGFLHLLLHRIPAPFRSASGIPAVHIFLTQASWNEAKKQISVKPREFAISSTFFRENIISQSMLCCSSMAQFLKSCLISSWARIFLGTVSLQRKQKMLIIFTVGLP